MFNVIFEYLRTILTPTRLRQPKLLAWLSVIISYLKKIYNEYISFRTLKLYDINFTGQLMYLQKKLRDTFNCPGIIIEDGTLILPLYLSNQNENNLPVYIGNYFINGHNYTAGEWVVFEGWWYEYTANGNGTTPDADNSAEQRDAYEFFLSNQIEITTQNDFIVKVPQVCFVNMTNDDILKMKSIINYYKIVNKQYTIIPY